MYIEQLKITGFKKFKQFSIPFKPQVNVLIGENEAGKSTILEAIDIVLNQKIFYSNNMVEKYFNIDNVNTFKDKPSIQTLPKIEIELFLSSSTDLNMEYFHGVHCSSLEPCIGLKFTYQFDENYRGLIENLFDTPYQNEITIPIDYYIAEWTTFAGRKYINRKSPLKNILIDNSIRKNNIFDSYSKKVFLNTVDTISRQDLSFQFRKNIQKFMNENTTKLEIQDYSFGFDESKTIFENLLDLKSDGISIQNMGKGKENLIKTEIALDASSDLILLEEPENHLSYINTRKLILDIQGTYSMSQIIITTHNPLIVSRLNIQNTIWVTGNGCLSLKDVPEETASYFMRTDNLQLLNYILARKVLLVEGNSEYILLPQLIKNTLNYTLDEKKIELISGGGITYKHYIELSKVLKNTLLVITDNDGDQETIDTISGLNDTEFNIYVKCPSNIEEFTFEICLFNENKEELSSISQKKPKTISEYRNKKMDKNLAYMLKNKTESALRISEEKTYKNNIKLPRYIQEGIQWLVQQ
ncbi:AAA family ATPase [Paenibacillus xylanexedens]|uniref:ATP-dependent nuclease n=1 Tax=Paenibacillus xylanexedens TaxID=528191 RepID=UPI001F1C2276|nr:AAA family ATPase [Paenibacillus xylanexedens]MCF7753969.1 AAA family ATPase [Paenibacillus xylanexedens]